MSLVIAETAKLHQNFIQTVVVEGITTSQFEENHSTLHLNCYFLKHGIQEENSWDKKGFTAIQPALIQ